MKEWIGFIYNIFKKKGYITPSGYGRWYIGVFEIGRNRGFLIRVDNDMSERLKTDVFFYRLKIVEDSKIRCFERFICYINNQHFSHRTFFNLIPNFFDKEIGHDACEQ